MDLLKRIGLKIIKYTPLRRLLLQYSKSKRWKSISGVDLNQARKEVENLHPRPKGHAIWRRNLPDNYQYDLSIIVPFYNTERYARRCIDSLLNQKNEFSVEIILVNDGSTDDCGKILDAYTRSNVKVYHKENGGLSDARNFGIEHSSGEYLLFCDSDDYLAENAVNSLLTAAKKNDADIVEGGFCMFNDRGKHARYLHRDEISSQGDQMFGYAWGKVIKASLFENVCFPVGYWFEDTVIGGLIYPLAGKTVTISNVVYYYYANANGITQQAFSDLRCIDSYYIIEELLKVLSRVGISINSKLHDAIIFQLSVYILSRCCCIDDKNLKRIFILCAELAKRYALLNTEYVDRCSEWKKEICLALVNMQYERWKFAAQLI